MMPKTDGMTAGQESAVAQLEGAVHGLAQALVACKAAGLQPSEALAAVGVPLGPGGPLLDSVLDTVLLPDVQGATSGSRTA